jgi:hypothetical protein
MTPGRKRAGRPKPRRDDRALAQSDHALPLSGPPEGRYIAGEHRQADHTPAARQKSGKAAADPD